MSTDVRTLMDMTGRVAAITGGAGHIGSVIAEAFAELGAAIVVVDLDRASCDSVAGSLHQRFGVDAIGHAADLGHEASIQGVAPFVEKQLGRLDVLVNA